MVTFEPDMITAPSSEKWRTTVNSIQNAQRVSSQFCTLRYMYHDSFLEEDKLQVVKKLGAGQFGTVYKCQYQGKTVAVKVLKKHFANTNDETMFVKEVDLLKKLRHPNIIGYVGTGHKEFEQHQQLFLAADCIEGGSLQSLLLKQQASGYGAKIYSTMQAYNWICDIAKGLQYLHKSLPMIIHRDLKLENILLDRTKKQSKAVIVDFGLHTLIRQQMDHKKNVYALTGKTGSYVYMAPEVFLKKDYNEKVDVYSFAIIAYEMFSKSMVSVRVSPNGEPQEVINYASRAAFGQRPPIPTNFPKKLHHLVEACWQQEPAQRPVFDKICKQLVDMQPDITAWHMEQVSKAGCCTIM
eukprot:TRINITY_DN3452_c0_g1_i10.p1 TRINITY_DN3452_c0_g1~~TRINITY_DN3452_c0_g1_i10.p1  ORF type:complete len:353 (-),score=39.57 TRINITY_DN3452_c0_g1_i10:294-1352(-)